MQILRGLNAQGSMSCNPRTGAIPASMHAISFSDRSSSLTILGPAVSSVTRLNPLVFGASVLVNIVKGTSLRDCNPCINLQAWKRLRDMMHPRRM